MKVYKGSWIRKRPGSSNPLPGPLRKTYKIKPHAQRNNLVYKVLWLSKLNSTVCKPQIKEWKAFVDSYYSGYPENPYCLRMMLHSSALWQSRPGWGWRVKGQRQWRPMTRSNDLGESNDCDTLPARLGVSGDGHFHTQLFKALNGRQIKWGTRFYGKKKQRSF